MTSISVTAGTSTSWECSWYRRAPEKLTEKELGTGYAAKLLRMMGADGIVMSWMGGGHFGRRPNASD